MACRASEPDYLLFRPTDDQHWLWDTMENTPRYLFRVLTVPSHQPDADERLWARSKNAKAAHINAGVDAFARCDRKRVATMLNNHLRRKGDPDDNFVSWSSSLLHVLLLMCEYGWEDEVHLCILDTTEYPAGVFLRGLDLISSHRSFRQSLRNLEQPRFDRECHRGAYLSQGSLRIEGKSKIVQVSSSSFTGLFSHRSEPVEIDSDSELEPLIASECLIETIRRRRFFSEAAGKPPRIPELELEQTIALAELFGPPWRLPIAASFLALQPCRRDDRAMLRAFNSAPFTDVEREACSPFKTKIITHKSLPEVNQFQEIMQSIYREFCISHIMYAENALAIATTRCSQAKGSAFTEGFVTCPDLSVMERVKRICEVRVSTQALRDGISGESVVYERDTSDDDTSAKDTRGEDSSDEDDSQKS